MMPRPSHPIRRKIRWGIKIKRFIEITNRSTRVVNRSRRWSQLM